MLDSSARESRPERRGSIDGGRDGEREGDELEGPLLHKPRLVLALLHLSQPLGSTRRRSPFSSRHRNGSTPEAGGGEDEHRGGVANQGIRGSESRRRPVGQQIEAAG
jgi:hypothetical protein